jgi:hypothetical protein
MSDFSRFWRFGALFLVFSAVLGAATNPPSRDDFFGSPNLRQPRLSPDGKLIAFLFPHEKKMALGLFDRTSGQSRMILRGEDESIYSFFWKGNDRIVFEADVSGNESFFIGSTDLTGARVLRIAESQRIDNNLTGDFAGILHHLPLDPERVAVIGFFAGNIDNSIFVGGAPIVARLNVRNRGLSPLLELKDSERFASHVFDQRGTYRLRARLDGKTLVWEHRRSDSEAFKPVAHHPYHGYAETWEPKEFAADNVTLWMISLEEHDRGALYAMDTRTFARGPALFVPPAGEITEIVVSQDRKRLLGVRYEAERGYYHWFDAERGALQAKLEKTFAGCEVRLSSLSDDENVALVWAGHDREPGTYYVLDQRAGSLTQFKRSRDLDPAAISRSRATRTARTSRWSSIPTAARSACAIRGATTPTRSSSPAGATPCCSPTIAAPAATGASSSARDATNGAARCRTT